MSLKYRHAFYQTLFGRNGCCCCKGKDSNNRHQRRDSMWNWWTGGHGYMSGSQNEGSGKNTKRTYRFRGIRKLLMAKIRSVFIIFNKGFKITSIMIVLFTGKGISSNTEPGNFSSTGLNSTETSMLCRRHSSRKSSNKGPNIQRCHHSPSSMHASQFDNDTCCDPVLAANMAALAFSLNTSRYKFKK